MSFFSSIGARKCIDALFLASLWVALVAFLGGCQIDVSGALGAKAFYPNKLGKERDIGDPRTGMYGAEHFKGLTAEKGGE